MRVVTAPGFEVPTAAMRGAADGIDALIDELGSLTTAGRAGEGRGVPGVELDADQLGHEGLASSFAQFCLRWDWGVRALVQDGSGMADGLRETVQSYEQADDGAGAAFSRMFDMVLGDPAGDPGPGVESPGDVLSGAARDYLSGERWSQAGTSMTDTWSDVAQDLAETAQDRAGRAAAGENPYGPDIDALREIVD